MKDRIFLYLVISAFGAWVIFIFYVIGHFIVKYW